ncbi:MAG TPA: proline iminopeptidase-family hydrolase [Thermoplasmata archaeon]|nr:proline iminopeptidase-family hydrolase [Thermoplasmata archaeon]
MTPLEIQDGVLPVNGYRLYWKNVGAPGPKGTLLTLHGGPGATHDYLLSLNDLADLGYRIVYYDQLGCGRSDLARRVSEYTVERDVADLESLRTRLGLGRVHLFGSSYGGMLAIAYALAHPEGLKTLISASGLADVPLAAREMQRLKRELPPPIRETLERYEARGEFQNPEYLAAVMEFYRRHLCRLDPWPAEVTYSLDHISVPKYGTMNGPNEFTIVGTMKDWDATPRLGEIGVPTLVTAGRYDEVTPTVAESIHHGIRGSQYELFENSSHLAFWEERPRYMEVLRAFLDRNA